MPNATTQTEVFIKLLKKNLQPTEFIEWMKGKTHTATESGIPMYYDEDVDEFIRFKENGEQKPFLD